MARIDVCNGDADGLFALVQLRLADPRPAQLITGLKHDIELLEQVVARAGDEVTVCDLSMRRNAQALGRLLAAGAKVRYFDHHESGPIPDHPGLESHIDLAAETCTSLIVDRHLGGRFAAWAAAAAWGDNLGASAERVADRLGLGADARASLQALGEAVNYNAYGESLADPLVPPAELFGLLVAHANPLDAWTAQPLVRQMALRRREDLDHAHSCAPMLADERVRLWVLPDAAWSRRVLGPFANQVAVDDPARAHAVARLRADGRLDVSVRSPLSRRAGADRLCRTFGGGGRAAAAAIDGLAPEDFDRFVAALRQMDWGPSAARAGS